MLHRRAIKENEQFILHSITRKNKIRFNEKYIRENKLSGDALRNFITGCCEELFSRKQQGLDEISYEEQSHQSKICDC
jgi:hypothetical protein